MGTRRTTRRSTRAASSDRQRLGRAVEAAEKLADENAKLQARAAAAARVERDRRARLAGLPKLGEPGGVDARYARLQEMVGEPSFAPEPGKFGGFTPSERARVEDARRRANLRASKPK